MSGVVLGIGMPSASGYVPKETALSLAFLDKPRDTYILNDPRGGDVGEKRDMMAAEALKKGCTHLLFLDDDMAFPQQSMIFDMLRVMEEHCAGLVGVLCYRGYPPYDPLIWKEERLAVPGRDYNFGEVVHATATGAACLLVNTEVFLSLPAPWFQVVLEKEDKQVIRRGEDTYFTRRVTKAGWPLRIITEYDTLHMRNIPVDRYLWMSYRLSNAVARKDGWEGVSNLANSYAKAKQEE